MYINKYDIQWRIYQLIHHDELIHVNKGESYYTGFDKLMDSMKRRIVSITSVYSIA